MSHYDYGAAHPPIPREYVPTMKEWRSARHRPFDVKHPGIFARLFTVSREKLSRALGRR